jgi:cytochrome P450
MVCAEEGEAAALASFPIRRQCPLRFPDEYRRLRAAGPIGRVRMPDGRDAWILTRHKDVRAVLTDPRFSADRTSPGFPTVSHGGKGPFSYFATFLNSMDGQVHSSTRSPLIPEFSVRRVNAFRPRIQEIVDGAIDRILRMPQPVDLVHELAVVVPTQVIVELVGANRQHLDRFYALQAVMLSRTTTAEEHDEAARGMRRNMDRLVAEKEANQGDDIVSRQIRRQLAENGEIDRAGLASLAQFLLSAGHETTTQMIALGVFALLSHPEQLAEIVADPAKTTKAIDELLRYFSVVEIGMARVALEDVEIAGAVIRAGEGVIASNIAANHDPEVFEDPDTLNLMRDAQRHVAQGHGPHQCLGQNVARAELQIVFDTLFRRIPGLRLAAGIEELPFKYDGLVFGMHQLPVRW